MNNICELVVEELDNRLRAALAPTMAIGSIYDRETIVFITIYLYLVGYGNIVRAIDQDLERKMKR